MFKKMLATTVNTVIPCLYLSRSPAPVTQTALSTVKREH